MMLLRANQTILIFSLLLVTALSGHAQTDASGYPVPVIGTKAMNIEGKDLQGKKIPLFSLNENYIVLFFYETSCHFCEAIFPEMKLNYPEWKKKGLEVYSVPVNRDYDGWKILSKEQNFPWINVMDTLHLDSLKSAYKISVSPTIFILDKSRNIVSSRLVRPDGINEWLEQNLQIHLPKQNEQH